MKTIPFLIVADRGVVKAYQVEQTNHTTPRVRLIDRHEVNDAVGRYQDKVTDQAGGFPKGGSGGQGNGIAEKMTLEAEMEMRSFRHIAAHIEELIHREQPERWALAAPSEINGAILDGLSSDLKSTLASNVRRDLINVPDSELPSHFVL